MVIEDIAYKSFDEKMKECPLLHVHDDDQLILFLYIFLLYVSTFNHPIEYYKKTHNRLVRNHK